MPITIPNYPLPANLPEDWQPNQIVAPDGTAVGLDEQHGYNYLMGQVNNTQEALNGLVMQANSVTADSAALVAGSISVTTSQSMTQGVTVKFESPCDSGDVTVGIVVDGIQYQWRDTLGESLVGIEGLFAAGAMVGIILDRENVIAYLVNSSPAKGYIEVDGDLPEQMLPGALYGQILANFGA